MPSTSRSGDVRASGAVLAAGGVVLRKGRVLLVHRPAYDDWSFPKGKLNRGEPAPAAAVREFQEETGLRIRLGMPLSRQSYPNGSRTKVVDYWIGRLVGDYDVSGYSVNHEIDEVAWVDVEKARRQLTYKRDRHTLEEALAAGKPTRALLVLRHAEARSRKRWKSDDRERPLLVKGMAQARAAIPVLAAYGVSRVVTSSSVRCVQSIRPYADRYRLPMTCTADLSEEDATDASVRAVVDDLLRSREDAVLCTHRPVLPTVYDELGLVNVPHPTGQLVVVHHRRGRVRAVERHLG